MLNQRRRNVLRRPWPYPLQHGADFAPPRQQVMVRLKLQKEPVADAEIARKPQVGVRGHRALAKHDLVDAPRRHADRAGERGLRQSHWLEEFLHEDFARMRVRQLEMFKWLPGNMSRPHWHLNDRYITVLKGTWWVGTGNTFEPDTTVALPAGSYVTHFGKEVHYDGAKDGEAWLLIVGEGPETPTPASPPPPPH